MNATTVHGQQATALDVNGWLCIIFASGETYRLVPATSSETSRWIKEADVPAPAFPKATQPQQSSDQQSRPARSAARGTQSSSNAEQSSDDKTLFNEEGVPFGSWSRIDSETWGAQVPPGVDELPPGSPIKMRRWDKKTDSWSKRNQQTVKVVDFVEDNDYGSLYEIAD